MSRFLKINLKILIILTALISEITSHESECIAKSNKICQNLERFSTNYVNVTKANKVFGETQKGFKIINYNYLIKNSK